MATEAVCMDTHYRPPPLHCVTSADDVMHYYYNHRPGQNAVDRRGPWTSHVDDHDSVPGQQMARTAASWNCWSGTGRGEVCYYRRKMSVDDGATSRPGGVVVVGGTSRRRPLPTSASDDAASCVMADDCSSSRRRSSVCSPPAVSTLSRTLSEHTLDRSARYRGAQCRDDLLDEWSVDADRLESVLSPPRIAPVSGQLSLVCSPV